MTLKERINSDYLAAFKARDTDKKNALSVLKARITEEEKKQKVENLDDSSVLTVIAALAKQRQQTIEIYKYQVNTSPMVRPALDKEEEELFLLQSYLPQQLSDSEITTELDRIFAGLVPGSNFIGLVMKHFKEKFNGQYDSKQLKTKVDSYLKR